MLKVKVKVLKDFIDHIILEESWVGAEAMPNSIDSPEELEPAVIQPKTETQVADTDLPIEDDDWSPGNLQQLGMALKQLAELVPEGQIPYFWPRAKMLMRKAKENSESLEAQKSAVSPQTADTGY